MKECSSCRRPQPHSEFNVRRASHDGLQSICRCCDNERARRYYSENREAHVRVIMARKATIRLASLEAIGEYLADHPCVDCGESDLRVLDFDHREGVSKHNEVMKLAHDGYSIARVLAEIAKCDVRCRNCHARVTYARQGYTWRTAFIDRRSETPPRPAPG